jgi:hypothetical protein
MTLKSARSSGLEQVIKNNMTTPASNGSINAIDQHILDMTDIPSVDPAFVSLLSLSPASTVSTVVVAAVPVEPFSGASLASDKA